MEQTNIQQRKKKLVQFLLDRNILIDPEFMEKLNSTNDPNEVSILINQKLGEYPQQPTKTETKKRDGTVKIVSSYINKPRKMVVQDFINYFGARYTTLKRILQQRSQLENATSIGKLKAKQEREVVSAIGLVYEKEDTKNGYMVTLEDPTGFIKVYFSKNKADISAKAQDIILDEVIGITGSMGKNIVFANDVYFPDVPVTKELRKSPDEEYAVFISDTHVGSTYFLEDQFLKFISWIRGETGTEAQQAMAAKVKYLFVTGDLVDGISNHPGQRESLNIFTFKEQYSKATSYLKMVPTDIQIIICPGNHDIVPIAEPQPPLPISYCEELHAMPNITIVSNPALVNIGSKTGFPGFDVLMYHGYSFNYYADKVESIRIQKPNISERAPLVMKMQLLKRHLTPTYDGHPHLPTDQDHLIIDKIPDIFIAGDVHKSAVFTYKNVITGIIGSCFQARTDFQEWVGHVPDPGRVPVVNLKTREVKVLNFGDPIEE